ncbi:hypothetical protein L9F63_009366, partial [Diploptera punctata]
VRRTQKLPSLWLWGLLFSPRNPVDGWATGRVGPGAHERAGAPTPWMLSMSCWAVMTNDYGPISSTEGQFHQG